MNTLTAPPLGETKTAKRPGLVDRFLRNRIHRVFQPLRRGRLLLISPEGETRVFGRKEPGPEARIQVRSPRFYQRCVTGGDIGFGESFVAGEWETPDLVAVISWFLANVEQAPSLSGSRRRRGGVNLLSWLNRRGHRARSNTERNSRRNIHEHYDLGNDFYRLWLDETMTYSSGLFVSPEMTLEQSQAAKYDALCRRLRLQPSDHVLEIGTGWGGFTCHAVKNYGCRVTTVTISADQYGFARQRFIREGLGARADVQLQDYRRLHGRFDKIASIEMLEAVGDEFLEEYFSQCHRLLKPDGLLGLQFINSPDSRYEQFRDNVDWIQKHIFPGSLCPSIGRVGEAMRNTGDLFLHHLDDFGLSYARTLKEWRERFNTNAEAVAQQGFDETFSRKWNYYLAYCEAAFAMRNISVVQAIYTRPNNRFLMR
jgi:cyclopropane-fatty-acyl-phospholipid synthase